MKKKYIVTLFLIITLFIYLLFSYWNKKMNFIDWGVRTAESSFTQYNNYSKVSLSAYMLSSEKNENLTTYFALKNGTKLRRIGLATFGGWGLGGQTIGGGNIQTPVPEIFHMTYSEGLTGAIYQLDHIDLPSEKIKKIFKSNFKSISDGVTIINGRTRYSDIEIAVAPKGWVTLYAIGGGNRIEIGSWQAKEISLSYPDYLEAIHLLSPHDNLAELSNKDAKKEESESYLKNIKESIPKVAYERFIKKEVPINADWYKKMQTKYPWFLEVNFPENYESWDGEYFAEYSNTERFEILDDQILENKYTLKPVPTTIEIWATEKNTKERYAITINLMTKPNWMQTYYSTYNLDQNLSYLHKRFEFFYPKLNYNTNNSSISREEYANLVLNFDHLLHLKSAELKKNKNVLDIDSAYQKLLAPIDRNRGKYIPLEYPNYSEEPKMKDLRDPVFAD